MPRVQFLQMKNHAEYRGAKICTRAKGREVSGMISKRKKIKFGQCSLGLGKTHNYTFKGQR